MMFGFGNSALTETGACLAIGALSRGQGLPRMEAAGAGPSPGAGTDPGLGLEVVQDQGELVTVRLPRRKLSFSWSLMS